ncbi:MAG: hypothetical protein QN178_17270 [Armatimonadota bacterium]|nr:hypothetical protein [Armatimonadota bacterium]
MDAIESAANRVPRFVQDDQGRIVEVILSYDDYARLLRVLAEHADWETLPPHLQDAIDGVLAADAATEGGSPKPLREVLRETGEVP